MTADILATLQRIEGHLATIVTVLATEAASTKTLSATDARVMTKLFIALEPKVRLSWVLTTAELLAVLPVAVRTEIEQALGATGPHLTKRMGKTLRRCAGCRIGGMLLERDGEYRGSVNWRVSRVS